jgi:hypothetical protein
VVAFGAKQMKLQSVADIVGPWVDPEWNSGLIQRCRKSWATPIRELSNEMLATFLRQDIATEIILEEASQRLLAGFEDESEIYEGELAAAVEKARGRGTSD